MECVFSVVVLISFSLNVFCTQDSGLLETQHLILDLLSNYSVLTPAFGDSYGNVSVTLDMNLVAILGIDAVHQTFSFSAHFEIVWEDPRLKWNKSEYGNIENLQLDPEYIWYPKFYLLNPADDSTNLQTNLPLYINNNGRVALRIYTIFRTTCSLNTRRYPFDTQACNLLLSCPRGSAAQFVLSETENIPNDLLSIASEWKLKHISGTVINHIYNYDLDTARFTIVMERKSICYITSTICPMFLLSFLTSLVFLFPPNSGEKLSYLISIFVSYAVFLNFINDSMPRTSLSISNLEAYLLSVLLHCVTAILATIYRADRGPQTKDDDADSDDAVGLKCCRGLFQLNMESSENVKKSAENTLKKIDWILFGFFVTSSFLLLGIFVI